MAALTIWSSQHAPAGHYPFGCKKTLPTSPVRWLELEPMRSRWSRHMALGLACVLGLLPSVAWSACNLIPSAAQAYRGTVGSLNKPYAAPGDFVEVGVAPAGCDGTSEGIGGPAGPTSAYDVTVAFTPSAGGTRRVVVLTSDCDAAGARLATCGDAPGLEDSRVSCIDDTAGLALVDRNGVPRLSFRFPDTDAMLDEPNDDHTLAGPATIAVTQAGSAFPCTLGSQPCTATGGVVACIDALYAPDGTCAPTPHPTFSHFTALPVPNDYQAACFADAPEPCTAEAEETRIAVDAQGNLLVPVNWEGVLVREGNVPVPRLLRATLVSPLPFASPPAVSLGSFTPEGAPLPPIFEPQAGASTDANVISLFGSADASYTILRVARGRGACADGLQAGAPCVDSRDCRGGVCERVCVDGPRANTVCVKDGDCGKGRRCATLYADFRPLPALTAGGPLILSKEVTTDGRCQQAPHEECGPSQRCPDEINNPCVRFAYEARTPVPLDGLTGSPEVFAFTIRETVANRDLNGDDDEADTVQTLQDRDTGTQLALGTNGALGRAVVALAQPPFREPAVATEDDVVAFLEPESAQGHEPAQVDANGDEDTDDAILRVYRASGTSATELTGAFTTPLAVDADLQVNGRSLVVSGGQVFFRVPEGGGIAGTTRRVSVDSNGNELPGPSAESTIARPRSLSDDGRFVVFESKGVVRPDLDADSGGQDVYVHDRDPDGNGVFDENPAAPGSYELITVDSAGVPLPFTLGPRTNPSTVGNGRYVVFSTTGINLRPGMAPTCPNLRGNQNEVCRVVALRDRTLRTTELVSIALGDADPNGESDFPVVTPDGRYVAFWSSASNLTPGDTNFCRDNGDYPNDNPGSCPDMFVRDRCVSDGVVVAGCTPHTERVSVGTNGGAASDGGAQRRTEGEPSISADGRYVVFQSKGGYDGSTAEALFVRDRSRAETRPATSMGGVPAFARSPSLSNDGRLLAFDTTANFAPGDAGGFDVYLRDLPTLAYLRISTSTEGTPGAGPSHTSTISPNGRFVVFSSSADNLVPDDSNSPCVDVPYCTNDIFVRDVLTGATKRVHVAWNGTQANSRSLADGASVSNDGRTVVFTSLATNLVPGDTNGIQDVFIRTLDWGAAATADRTGDLDGNDTVLAVVDATAAPASEPMLLCPATQVSVYGGAAVFIRPASAGTTTMPNCPPGTPVDDRVHVWPGKGQIVVDFGLPGVRAVALSALSVAAIDGAGTLQVSPRTGPSWTATGLAAASVRMCGETVAVTQRDGAGVPKLRLYEPGVGVLPIVVPGVRDVVCNGQVIAYRVDESELGVTRNDDLPQFGDGDTADQVLEVYDLTQPACRTLAAPATCRVTTRRAVTPCNLAACDPRAPYRVFGDTVKFLTFEPEQGGHDLNDDGDAQDMVLQIYDVATETVTVVGTPEQDQSADPLGGGEASTPVDGEANSDPGVVFPAVGRCLETLAIPTTCSKNAECGAAAFCTEGQCQKEQGVCAIDADCPPGLTCTKTTGGGIVAASPDGDSDGVPDHVDTCPEVANGDQADSDDDGVGDACDQATCGNGIVEYDEACDDSNAASCAAGCTDDCACTQPGGGASACGTAFPDPATKVTVKTAKGSGTLDLKTVVPVDTISPATPLTVELADGDSTPIVRARIVGLIPLDEAGTKLRYKVKTTGLQQLLVKRKQPGMWQVKVKAKRWFTAAQANQPAAQTYVTLRIGTACFSGSVTTKRD